MAVMMVFALLGNSSRRFGTDILKATTISGTMVTGHPAFIPVYHHSTRLGFHLSF
jgi:hypothetical protein